MAPAKLVLRHLNQKMPRHLDSMPTPPSSSRGMNRKSAHRYSNPHPLILDTATGRQNQQMVPKMMRRNADLGMRPQRSVLTTENLQVEAHEIPTVGIPPHYNRSAATHQHMVHQARLVMLCLYPLDLTTGQHRTRVRT